MLRRMLEVFYHLFAMRAMASVTLDKLGELKEERFPNQREAIKNPTCHLLLGRIEIGNGNGDRGFLSTNPAGKGGFGLEMEADNQVLSSHISLSLN